MKALIKVGYACNDRCVLCHAADHRHIQDVGRRTELKIARAAKLGHRMVVLSGGEPTISSDLFRLVRRASSLGLELGLITNARALAVPDLTDRLVGEGLRYAYVSLHGGTADIHDAVTRTPAFDQTLAGISNLADKEVDLTINCVVNRLNINHLRDWVECVLPFSTARLKLSMTEPKGEAWRHFDEVVPSVTDAAAAACDAISYAEKMSPARGILHDGFPLCLMPGFEDRYDDLWSHGFATMAEVWEDDLHPIDDHNKVQPAKCSGCGLRGPCGGLYKGYQERLGDSEIKARPGTRSNSYNLVPQAIMRWREGEPCPIRNATTPYDRARTLFLRNGERLTLMRTTSRDFATAELLESKLSYGQIYVDASDKPAPDDFRADLLKLIRLDTCEACPNASACTGCYRTSREDVFSRDDAAVREVVSKLRGTVLDVGCGEGLYDDVLGPLGEQGLIEYSGVDPDRGAIERLGARWPWADLTEARAEDIEPAKESLDHVLVLRSYNHIASPEKVMRSLVAGLRPGGTLLIVDNVAFGLVRKPRHAGRAEQGPARFEHYRNDSAADAAALLADLPLAQITRHDVSPATSNQWLLHFKRL